VILPVLLALEGVVDDQGTERDENDVKRRVVRLDVDSVRLVVEAYEVSLMCSVKQQAGES
jgi:hypothetical protein